MFYMKIYFVVLLLCFISLSNGEDLVTKSGVVSGILRTFLFD